MMSSQRKYRVVLIEPSTIISCGITSMISTMAHIELIDRLVEVSQLTETRLRKLSPDIVIVNPSVQSYSNRMTLRASLPYLSEYSLVAMVSSLTEDEILRQYDAYINIYDSAEKIEKRLMSVAEQTDNSSRNEYYELSTREREVLVEVAKGKTNKEIADQMNLSVYTVVTHRKNISRKLGIRSISGLTVYAIMNKLINISDI